MKTMSILDLIPDIVGSIGLILLSIVSISHTKQIAELEKKVSFLLTAKLIDIVTKTGDSVGELLKEKEELKNADEGNEAKE